MDLRRYEGAQRMLHRPPTPSPSGRGLGRGCSRQAARRVRQGIHRQSYWGAPSPGLRPPSPRGSGVGFATVRGCPAHAPPPSGPLSLWERVGVRVLKASSPPGTARNPQAELLGRPHPAFGHPLPKGEGLDLRRYEGAQRMLTALRPPLPLGEGWGEGAQGKQPAEYGKESHRQSYWGALTRPSATLSQRERGWVCDGTRVPSACSPPSDPLSLWERVEVRVLKASSPPGTARNRTGRAVGEPSPGLRPPSPRGRGVGFATVRGCPAHAPPPSDPLSLWERVGVRVAKASSPPGTARNRTGRAVGEPSPGLRPPSPRGRGVGFATVRGCPAHAPPPSDPLSLWERVGVRVAKATAPPGTARNEAGRAVGAPSPGLRPPSPRGRGVGFATVRGCPAHAPPPSDPLSLWERVGVRVLKASSPPSTARNRTGRAIGAPSPGLRPPSPRGRGVGFATVRGCPAHAHRPPTPSPSGRGLG